jgi:hypothetical protein
MAAAGGAGGHRHLFEMYRGTRSDFRRLLELILQSAVPVEYAVKTPFERQVPRVGNNPFADWAVGAGLA